MFCGGSDNIMRNLNYCHIHRNFPVPPTSPSVPLCPDVKAQRTSTEPCLISQLWFIEIYWCCLCYVGKWRLDRTRVRVLTGSLTLFGAPDCLLVICGKRPRWGFLWEFEPSKQLWDSLQPKNRAVCESPCVAVSCLMYIMYIWVTLWVWESSFRPPVPLFPIN